MEKYYTYAYLREDRTPYYIGKGKERRINSSQKNIKKPRDKSRIIFLKQNLTEEEAFKHEIYMIAVFGRKDLGTGILYNKTDGGEGISGFNHNKKTKRKLSESRMGRKWWNNGKVNKFVAECPGKGWISGMTEEVKRNHSSESSKGKNHYLFGKSISKETKRKMSEANKGKRWWNDRNGNTKFSRECPGEGWILGRGKRFCQG